jgi:hypothetical protein
MAQMRRVDLHSYREREERFEEHTFDSVSHSATLHWWRRTRIPSAFLLLDLKNSFLEWKSPL